MGHPTLDISQITDQLFISAYPRSGHAPGLEALGVRLILSMDWRQPSPVLNKPPLRLLWLPTFDHPWLPMPLTKLHKGVTNALPVLQEGGKVLVHCRYGVHRSVAMACCVLVGTGMTSEAAMQLVSQRRKAADPYARHIRSRIQTFESIWRQS